MLAASRTAPCALAILIASCGPGSLAHDDLEVKLDLPPPWECVGKVKKPRKPKRPFATYRNKLMEFRLGPPQPFPGVTVRACLYEDRDCVAPIDTAVSGADGAFAVELPLDEKSGFFGYLELEGADITPTLLFLDPIVEDTVEPFVFALRAETFQHFATEAGVVLDPARGHVGMAAIGCDGLPAAGARFESEQSDEGTTRVCSGPGGVQPTNTVTTLPSGHCGFFNVPPVDEIEVVGYLDEHGLEYSRRLGWCRPGFNCELPMRPSPKN